MKRKKERTPFIRPLPLSVKHPQLLFKHVNFLVDPVEQTITGKINSTQGH